MLSNELESDSGMVTNLERSGVDGAGFDETETAAAAAAAAADSEASESRSTAAAVRLPMPLARRAALRRGARPGSAWPCSLRMSRLARRARKTAADLGKSSNRRS
jgi:hypothetical protein